MNATKNRMGWKGLTLALAGLLSGSLLRGQASDLGRIDFPTSGSPEAQKHFLRGALLLHSFEYEDAAEEFREAEKLEPGFAMAYWGEAETQNHPIWVERDAESARKILNRLAPTPDARLARAPTRREKGYLEAVEILFAEGKKPERDRAYAEAMSRLHEQHPDDPEAASFYALALLGACQGKRDTATYMKAAAVAEEVFAKNPMHPGAVHYLIHSYDDPVHAPLGMRAARVYARIAPAAGHALHMPSHIFFASGLWEEAAASNEAAWKASVERAERKRLGPDSHSDHALHWLEFAYLQLGRYADARKTLAAMEEDAGKSGSKQTRGYLAAMRATYLVETRRWNGDAVRIRVGTEDPSERERSFFLEGLQALEAGDRPGAEKTLAQMKTPPKEEAGASGHAHGGSSMSYMGRRGAGADAVLQQELEAKILLAKGEADRALTLAREAAVAEDAMNVEFGPPAVVKPAHELLGEMLLALQRPADARQEFERSLEKAPGRALSLLGLARSAARAGDTAAARQAYAELAKNWRRADADLPERGEISERAVAAPAR